MSDPRRYDRAILRALDARPYQTAGQVARTVGSSGKFIAARLRYLERRRRVKTYAMWNAALTWGRT